MKNNKKIAFCLHGLAAGKNFKHGGLNVTFESESSLYKKHILNINNCDVFLHSWSTEAADDLISTYQPEKYLFENPTVFVKPALKEKIKDFKNKIRGKKRELYRINNIYSRWATFKRVIDLVSKHEDEKSIKYDFIFVGRFDMSLFSDLDFNNLDNSKFYSGKWIGFRDSHGNIISDEKIEFIDDKKFKYEKGFPSTNEGISDFWFAGSPSKIFEFAEIFDELESLIKTAGKSNHKIALEKIKRMGMLENYERVLEFSSDYQLTRWLK